MLSLLSGSQSALPQSITLSPNQNGTRNFALGADVTSCSVDLLNPITGKVYDSIQGGKEKSHSQSSLYYRDSSGLEDVLRGVSHGRALGDCIHEAEPVFIGISLR